MLDHIGSLRLHRGSAEDDAKIMSVWKEGIAALAALPHVHVKLSMVGYSVPGWQADAAKEEEVKAAFRYCIEQFGTERCMFASNFPVDLSPDEVRPSGSFRRPRPLC